MPVARVMMTTNIQQERLTAYRDCLPQVLGVFLRAVKRTRLIVIMLQVGLHQPGSIMRTEDESTHEQHNLQVMNGCAFASAESLVSCRAAECRSIYQTF